MITFYFSLKKKNPCNNSSYLIIINSQQNISTKVNDSEFIVLL